MDWDALLSGLLTLLFAALAAIASVILAPVDLLINVFLPQANQEVKNFFDWVISMIQSMGDFLDWFLFITGMQPSTWSLIMVVLQVLVIIFMFLFPVKLILSTFRGFRG